MKKRHILRRALALLACVAALFSASGGVKALPQAFRIVATVGTQRKYLALGGELVGLRLRTRGVLVVGTERFVSADGADVSPAADAGIKKGDLILDVDGQTVGSNESLTALISASGGRTLTVTYERDGKARQTRLTPQKTAATGSYKGGLWIRDATVGVGTLTFTDPVTGTLAALGHGVSDADTGELLQIADGEIRTATVSSVKKGKAGAPGEITGVIGGNTVGGITQNKTQGVYGELYYMDGEPELYPMATASEVHTGSAQIVCTVTDGEKQFYDIEITKLGSSASADKNMVLKVTDEALLRRTGGIVQGMSGSPIVQDGMLVGAVTHVLVSDPKCGYGIYAENMLSAAG